MKKFRGKYRIETTRLQNWDYGWNAPYFVTICTQSRECYFGDVVVTQNFASPYKMQLSDIGAMAINIGWNDKPKTIGQKRFQNQGKNTLSSILGSYKPVVTKNAREIDAGFAWQSRFHDHIIRNNREFEKISKYIIENPLYWNKDKFNN